MKKLLFIALLITTTQINAQTPYIAIPDSNFVHYLKSIVPTAFKGDSLNTINTLVTTSTHTINVRGKSISNLTGVEYFTALTWLDCSQNSITSIPVLANSLQILWCSQNSITTLPALPNSLQYLFCDTNNLTTLPALPNNIYNISCWHNAITSFPTFPNSLTYLGFVGNNVNALPTLPTSLYWINGTINQLSSLPTLPSGLAYLEVEGNYLTSLPTLPSSLKYLYCGHNNITSLPTLPSNLLYLYCDYASLTTLPSLPSSLVTLNCVSNNITCFPPFPSSITNLNLDPNPYNCLPNYIPAMGSDTATHPICAAGNSNGCAIAVGIEHIPSSNTEISIYPNPNNGSFVIEPQNTLYNVHCTVYDVNGKAVLNQTLNGKTAIDGGTLNEGVYNISLQSNEGVVNKRLVIVR